MPKISIIIPCYNVECYLSECLDSVIAQTFQDWEAICVDDGSPDNCGKILDEYAKKDTRIKVIHKENGGVSSARNAGLDVARGEWISFVDSDDYVDVNLYKSMMDKDYLNTDVIQFGYQIVNGKKDKIKKFENKELIGFEDIIFSIDKCYLWNKLWKTEFLNKNNIRFVNGIAFCEDVLFTVQSVMCSSIWRNIEIVGYFYRYNETSVSNDKNKKDKRRLDKYNVAKQVIELAKQKKLPQNQLEIMKDFAIDQLVFNEDVIDKKIYKKYEELFVNNKNLIKKRKKAIKKWFFSFSMSKKRCVFLGKNFWPSFNVKIIQGKFNGRNENKTSI